MVYLLMPMLPLASRRRPVLPQTAHATMPTMAMTKMPPRSPRRRPAPRHAAHVAARDIEIALATAEAKAAAIAFVGAAKVVGDARTLSPGSLLQNLELGNSLQKSVGERWAGWGCGACAGVFLCVGVGLRRWRRTPGWQTAQSSRGTYTFTTSSP